MLSLEDIDNLAALARLSVSAEEKEILRRELVSILEYVSEVQKLSGADFGAAVDAEWNVFREDGPAHLPGEYTDLLLEEAPEVEDGYIRVKKIL
jgi:aspartyl-tRNA(Asn)/glutamyl-tRNA(Gln) amidotransferase subunit C